MAISAPFLDTLLRLARGTASLLIDPDTQERARTLATKVTAVMTGARTLVAPSDTVSGPALDQAVADLEAIVRAHAANTIAALEG